MGTEVSWLSILPPIIAIGLAIAFRQVVVALLAGVWLGALFLSGYNPLLALVKTVDTYALNAM
ncbi:MAG: Na+/H+ antiporter NhaC family protein, partial [Deltaproteobacteria bacterium]|nr:Na+/H+ antiporter NhaC family protein [Deltaproteobacteria bacterium]